LSDPRKRREIEKEHGTISATEWKGLRELLLVLGDQRWGTVEQPSENRGLFPVGRDENNTPNHISVLVEDSDATIILAGDTSYNEGLMLAGKVDGVGSNTQVSAATLAAIKRFAATQPTIYLPTHDPESAARLAARRSVPAAA